ncbi:MAG TPA: GTP-binding protein [Candidatus Marinimicrobia bacterium]|nr:GTP-binding protein [Candidatus Neomarinimicrobiota bacterium]
MIPIRLVTGFLGSGKTTLLKNLIRQNQSRRLVFLVNEFSPADIDGTLLANLTPDYLSIPGGSIFCRCLAGKFIEYLQEIHRCFVRENNEIDELVIEASGVADPRVIFKMLSEARLDKVYYIREVLNIVDPISLCKLFHTLTSIRAQIEAADIVLINKTDIASPEAINQAESLIRQVNPSAYVYRTTFSQLPKDLPEYPERLQISSGEFALCRDPKYATIILDSCDLNYEQLQQTIAPVADDVYRLKGYLFDGHQSQYVDYSSGVWQVEPTPLNKPQTQIVVIVNGANQAQVIEHFKLCGLLENNVYSGAKNGT